MSIRKESKSTLLLDLFGILNAIVELYLTSIIKPFLTLHEKFYKQLNAVIRSFLDTHSEQIPEWFTANFITYARTVLVIPCVMMLVNNWLVIPSLMVLLVDFGDFLDGVVARYWVDKKKDDKYGTCHLLIHTRDRTQCTLGIDGLVRSFSPFLSLSISYY